MKSKISTGIMLGFLLLLLMILPLLLKVGGGEWLNLTNHIMTKIYLNVAFALSLWIILRAGMLSLGQAAFIAIGAYTTGILSVKYGLIPNIWVSYFIGAVLASVVAFLLGLITVHLRRIFFLLVTWAFAESLHPILTSFENPFGGAVGIVDIPAPQGLAAWGGSGFYYLALAYVALVFLVIWSLSRSKIGLIYKSIGYGELLTNFCGIYARRYKLQAFALGCFLTGIGGGILTSYLTTVSPESFTFFTSLEIIMFNLIGGMGVIAGPIVGAIALTGINELLFAVGTFKTIIYGLMIILAIRFLPGGLVSLPTIVKGFLRPYKKNKEALP